MPPKRRAPPAAKRGGLCGVVSACLAVLLCAAALLPGSPLRTLLFGQAEEQRTRGPIIGGERERPPPAGGSAGTPPRNGDSAPPPSPAQPPDGAGATTPPDQRAAEPQPKPAQSAVSPEEPPTAPAPGAPVRRPRPQVPEPERPFEGWDGIPLRGDPELEARWLDEAELTALMHSTHALRQQHQESGKPGKVSAELHRAEVAFEEWVDAHSWLREDAAARAQLLRPAPSHGLSLADAAADALASAWGLTPRAAGRSAALWTREELEAAAGALPQPARDGYGVCGDGGIFAHWEQCDGRCDCCDGSDEAGCPRPAQCAGTCQPARRERIAELRGRARATAAALGVRDSTTARAPEIWRKMGDELEAAGAEHQARRAAVEQKRSKLGPNMRPFDPRIRALQEEMMSLQMHAFYWGRRQQLRAADFGPGLALIGLYERCLNYTANERLFRGGCAEPDAHNSTFTVCLFANVTQEQLPDEAPAEPAPAPKPAPQGELAEGDHVVWQKSDDDVPPGMVGVLQGREGDMAAVLFPTGRWFFPIRELVRAEQQEEQPAPPTPLGFFSGTAVASTPGLFAAVPSGLRERDLMQVFTGGADCFEGPNRRVLVRISCGAETVLRRVVENGKCLYEALVETPHACTARHLLELQHQLRRELSYER
eukprot:TRINITY_DN7023_c0_g1_i1.p1 TRINITY_DN7023_c0_g1~~TRINITY_DN7023_c0_g1_i1.p1  ORF type:complete len:684 (+),score=155.92 TRINITY_DN7023_c0_g1_i1:93-2054(+)